VPAVALSRAGTRVVESGLDEENVAASAWQRLKALPDPRSPQGDLPVPGRSVSCAPATTTTPPAGPTIALARERTESARSAPSFHVELALERVDDRFAPLPGRSPLTWQTWRSAR
jgi:hypothetical protein